MPLSDNEDSADEEEVRAGAEEDWAITTAGRKVVHNTSVNADSKLYAYLAKRAGAAFPACQAAIDEFNSIAVVQAWRSQPAPSGTAGAPEVVGAGAGGTAGAAAGGGQTRRLMVQESFSRGELYRRRRPPQVRTEPHSGTKGHTKSGRSRVARNGKGILYISWYKLATRRVCVIL